MLPTCEMGHSQTRCHRRCWLYAGNRRSVATSAPLYSRRSSVSPSAQKLTTTCSRGRSRSASHESVARPLASVSASAPAIPPSLNVAMASTSTSPRPLPRHLYTVYVTLTASSTGASAAHASAAHNTRDTIAHAIITCLRDTMLRLLLLWPLATWQTGSDDGAHNYGARELRNYVCGRVGRRLECSFRRLRTGC